MKMRIGWFLLLTSVWLNLGLGAYVLVLGQQKAKLMQGMVLLGDENRRLFNEVDGLSKLKAMTLKLGSEPVRISGEMWVVLVRR